MQPSRTSETQGNHDLFDAFGDEGCPVCRLSLQAVSHYMNSTNYDALGDPAIRERFEASRGFCTYHAHQWLEEAFVLGTAQMYRDVIRSIRRDLEHPARPGRGSGIGGRVASVLGGSRGGSPISQPSRPCPACEVLAETEARLTNTLVKGLGDEPFRVAYGASDGLCIPHLRTALALAAGKHAFHSLRERALATEQTLLAQLDETIRKHDYRFRHEPTGEEVGSPARAVAHVAGSRGITDRDQG